MIPFLLILNSKHHEILFQKWFASSLSLFPISFCDSNKFSSRCFSSRCFSSALCCYSSKWKEYWTPNSFKKYMIEMRNSLWSKHPWEQNTSWNENIKHICEREKKTRRWKHESQAAIPTNLGDLKFFVTSVRSKKGFTVMPCFFVVVVVGSSSRVKLLIWPCRCLSSVERLPSVTCVTIIINQKYTYSCSVCSHLQMWTLFSIQFGPFCFLLFFSFANSNVRIFIFGPIFSVLLSIAVALIHSGPTHRMLNFWLA